MVKGEKKTVYHLRKYNRTQAEADYVAFLGFMEEQLEELHGGYMYIDGDINTGSRFYFTIAKNIT